MSVDDQSDVWRELRALKKKIQRLESTKMLENSSVTRGRMRFIGGTLRLDSGARLELVGTMDAEGTISITGLLNGSGDLVWSGSVEFTGPWNFTGDGEISGNVAVIGPGKVDVGTGDARTTIDGATGKFTSGSTLEIDPGHSDEGAQLLFGVSGGSNIYGEDDYVGLFHPAGADTAFVMVGGTAVDPIGVYLAGKVHLNAGPLPAGVTGQYMILGSDGFVYTGSVGGGGGGDTPPNPYPGGFVWPADPALYGISDNYADHVARGSAEPGTDVMTPVGAAVYAPADGEIRAVNTAPTGATGRLIVFRASNGSWFRFLHLSQVLVTSGAVTQGQLIGRTGGSGFGSEAYYGPHLHITYMPGPSDTQPVLTSSTDFEVVMAAQD